MLNNFKTTEALHKAFNNAPRYAFISDKVAYYDGIQNTNRVDGTTQRQLYTKVVDQVLNYPALYSRLVSQGEPFEGKVEDVTYDISADTTGQFFTSLETLNSTATNTTVTGSYAHTAYTQPVVDIMLEAFANVGSLGIINLHTFKYKKAAAQAMQSLGSAIYGVGNSSQPLGLTAIIDDSTNVATIGGLSRATYSALDSVLTAYSSGKLTLATMGTQYDSGSAGSLDEENPNVGVCDLPTWTLYEQLLTPFLRQSYRDVGYDRVRIRGKYGERSTAELKAAAGLDTVSFRNTWIFKDKFSTLQTLWFVNENYVSWKGRSEIPAQWRDRIEKVDFGSSDEAYEGTAAQALDVPSEFNGWFYQKPLVIPDQAGMIARFYVIGQTIPHSFRRHSKGTGITGV